MTHQPTPAYGAPLTEASAAELAAEAATGYAPDELSDPPFRVVLPHTDTSVIELRLPTSLARALTAKAANSHMTRDELAARAIDHLLASNG